MDRGIQILGLTDHNATQNLRPFAKACEVCSIMAVYGLEVTTVEEVHLLVLFEHVHKAEAFGQWIQSTLPQRPNNARRFGRQLIADDYTTIGEFTLMLASASALSFDTVVERGLEAGALVIPAHIDRPSYSVLTNLGFLPALPYSAVEMVSPTSQTWTVVTASDAHSLEQVGTHPCIIEMEEISWQALEHSLKGMHNVIR